MRLNKEKPLEWKRREYELEARGWKISSRSVAPKNIFNWKINSFREFLISTSAMEKLATFFPPCEWISVEMMQLCVFVNKLRRTSLAFKCIREFNAWPNFLSTGIIVEEKKIHNSMLNVNKKNFNMLAVFVVSSWDFFFFYFRWDYFFHENFVRLLAV